jgi:hypothetical protein
MQEKTSLLFFRSLSKLRKRWQKTERSIYREACYLFCETTSVSEMKLKEWEDVPGKRILGRSGN